MFKTKLSLIIPSVAIFIACQQSPVMEQSALTKTDSVAYNSHIIAPLPVGAEIDTRDIKPQDLVSYAKTLMGITYKYGSSNPAQGFDCSGYITHVFNHFNISVPRSSADFTNIGTEIPVSESLPGDLILFTGTDPTIRLVGHMGIIIHNKDSTQFIHSTSGKQYGVTITTLNDYYKGRYFKTIRIFK